MNITYEEFRLFEKAWERSLDALIVEGANEREKGMTQEEYDRKYLKSDYSYKVFLKELKRVEDEIQK